MTVAQFSFVPLSHSAPWNNLMQEKSAMPDCWKKKLEAIVPLPALLPLTNNKVQRSKETTLKLVSAGLRGRSRSGALRSDIGRGNT